MKCFKAFKKHFALLFSFNFITYRHGQQTWINWLDRYDRIKCP